MGGAIVELWVELRVLQARELCAFVCTRARKGTNARLLHALDVPFLGSVQSLSLPGMQMHAGEGSSSKFELK